MSAATKNTEVIFLRVSTAQHKVRRICALVHEHFTKGERVILRVPNPQAADYLNEALWRFPAEGFVPHVLGDEPCEDAVLISTRDGAFNQADVLFHLCPAASPQAERFSLVYELKDESGDTKHRLAQQRYLEYQRRGLALTIR